MKKFTLVWEPEDFSTEDYQSMIECLADPDFVHDGMILLVSKEDAETNIEMDIGDTNVWQRVIDFLKKHKVDYIALTVDI